MLSKSHLIKYFLILFALLFNHQIKASSLFVIDSYTVKDGLSHNTIWCALQDSYGFIWLGTNNGLNCFDGQKNTIYRNMHTNIAYNITIYCIILKPLLQFELKKLINYLHLFPL